ncbi:MAG TPA: hypothetical protein VF132_12335 [Rudaea sp.]
MNNERLPEWTAQAKGLLDESARDLDAATLSRLNRARQAALGTRRARGRTWMFPAGLASACMLLLAVAFWQHPLAPSAMPGGDALAGSPTDSEIVSGDDTLEFYQDLAFYAWLDAQQDNDNG